MKTKKIIKLSKNDVITSSFQNFLGLSMTFRHSELLDRIRSIFSEKYRDHYQICDENGYSCQVLLENGGGWQSGKIRISFEFVTEVEEADSDNSELSSNDNQSALDQIRQLSSSN